MAPPAPRIDGRSPREIFSTWVAEALAGARPPPSPLATAYLVDLLADQLRVPKGPGGPEPSLAESWLIARGAEGATRAAGLRAVGDRALFVAGFFGPSLTRRVVGIGYYRDIGQAAYGDLSEWLAHPSWDGVWRNLYAELAERFSDCLEILAAVSERSSGGGLGGVLHLYERWLASGSPALRRRLAAQGCTVGASPAGARTLQ